jgi:hypothetical protein
MTPEIKTKWVKALRSGQYQQIRDKVFQGPLLEGKPSRICALGVLYCLAIEQGHAEWAVNPHTNSLSAFWLSSVGDYTPLLAVMQDVRHWNDVEKLSFPEIADQLELYDFDAHPIVGRTPGQEST